MRMLLVGALLATLLPAIAWTAGRGGQPDYVSAVEAWRAERETRLTADDGWLTVAGLFFLREGENSFGGDPLHDIVLPAGPRDAGVFVLRDGKVTLRAAPGSTVTVGGEAVTAAPLWPYEDERPAATFGPLTLFVHFSGERLAIRMLDRNNAILRDFTGLDWYPVDEAYRVRGRFVPHDEPLEVRIQNILGDVETLTSSGTVRLSIRGAEVEMLPIDADGQLWFIFRDQTSGTATYPAARFLYADAPEDGWTTVDFNKAYNPPCAFNPHTTCPLPPRANRLPVRVEAGERDYRPGPPLDGATPQTPVKRSRGPLRPAPRLPSRAVHGLGTAALTYAVPFRIRPVGARLPFVKARSAADGRRRGRGCHRRGTPPAGGGRRPSPTPDAPAGRLPAFPSR